MDAAALALALVNNLLTAPTIYREPMLPGCVPSKEEFEKPIEDQTALEDQPNF